MAGAHKSVTQVSRLRDVYHSERENQGDSCCFTPTICRRRLRGLNGRLQNPSETVASIIAGTGTDEAQSSSDRPIMQTLRWIGVPGDTLFGIGSLILVAFVFTLPARRTRQVGELESAGCAYGRLRAED